MTAQTANPLLRRPKAQHYFKKSSVSFRFVHTKDKLIPYTWEYINTEVGYNVYDFDC